MTRTKVLAFCALVALAPAAVACGGGTPSAKTANVAQGEMPPGATFKGVWFNPAFGEMHLVTEGSTVTGKYKSQQNGIWGVIHGTATGDVIKFTWEEHKTGAIGPGSTRKGKGYWKYQPAEPPDLPKLNGEWGLEESEVGGGDWNMVKEKDREPDLNSIGGDADPSMSSGWDEPAKKPGDDAKKK